MYDIYIMPNSARDSFNRRRNDAGAAAIKKARGVEPRAFVQPVFGELLADGGGALGLLDDAGRLAAQVAQVIELGAAHLAAAYHLDRVDHGRHHGEHTFHAFAIGDFADREALIEPGAGTPDADAFIGLHARAVAFHHLDVDDHGVARSEVRNILAGGHFFELLFFELLNEVHRKSPSAARSRGEMRAGSANVGLSCADLALVYGKGGPLSPFGGAFWRFLTLVF